MNYHQLVEKLNGISVTHICDAEPDIRLISSSVKPFGRKAPMIGYAYTVSCYGDFLPVANAIEMAPENSVLLIDCNNFIGAVAGEICCQLAKKRNLAGIVIDGNCRDIDSIVDLNFPFYARGVNPKIGTKNRVGVFQKEVNCGGVIVKPGEVVIGDENGIVILTDESLNSIIEKAILIKNTENRAMELIKNGALFSDILNLKDHYENIKNGNLNSVLCWEV